MIAVKGYLKRIASWILRDELNRLTEKIDNQRQTLSEQGRALSRYKDLRPKSHYDYVCMGVRKKYEKCPECGAESDSGYPLLSTAAGSFHKWEWPCGSYPDYAGRVVRSAKCVNNTSGNVAEARS